MWCLTFRDLVYSAQHLNCDTWPAWWLAYFLRHQGVLGTPSWYIMVCDESEAPQLSPSAYRLHKKHHPPCGPIIALESLCTVHCQEINFIQFKIKFKVKVNNILPGFEARWMWNQISGLIMFLVTALKEICTNWCCGH